jgi:DNA-binding HxlR family transcriptional regulator
MTKQNLNVRRERVVESKDAKPASVRPRKVAGGEPSLDLDRIIHERLRLGILSALAVNASLTFNELKKLLQTSDGNLSVHARKLEEADYIVCEKSFVGRVPKTEYRMTSAGKKALERYLDEMEEIIRTTRKAQR